MKTRIIHTKIWEDEFFSVLNRASKLLFMYLITNQRANLTGIYEISDRVIAFDTGLTQQEIEQGKKDLEPKAFFFKGWVYLPNAQKLGGYSGSKNETAIQRELEAIPQDIRNSLLTTSDTVSKNSDTLSSISDTPINHKSEIINHKSKEDRKKLLEEDIVSVAESLSVSLKDAKRAGEEMLDYIASTGKVYKDYKATLRNWLRRKIDDGKIHVKSYDPADDDMIAKAIRSKNGQ